MDESRRFFERGITTVWVLIFWLLTSQALAAAGGATLTKVRIGKHPDFERMVFDLEGDRPVRVSPVTDQAISIEYKQLQTGLSPNDLGSHLPSAVKGVSIEEANGASLIKVSLRSPDVSVKPFFVTVSNNVYRLVLDFSERGLKPAPPVEEKAPPKALPKPQPKAKEKPGVPRAKERPDATAAQSAGSGEPPRAANEQAEALYKLADDEFLAHKEELTLSGPEIINRYMEAIKADPRAPQVPLSLYRCGLAYQAGGDRKRAEECFKRVISDSPDRPEAGPSWLHLGQIHYQKKAYSDAVLAYRTALNSHLDKSDQVDALFELGKASIAMSQYQEAVDALVKCQAEDALYHRRKPELLKDLGESYFNIRDYEKSADLLIWYLNLKPDAPDRDLILARLAENLLNQGQAQLAKKIYAYVERAYPDSEGRVIVRIRQAELLEQKDERSKGQAVAIYRELSQRSMPPALSRLVQYKLAFWAWKNGEYPESLVLVEDVLQTKDNSTAYDQCVTLRENILRDWTKKSFENKDYLQVVRLFQENKPVFMSEGLQEVLASVAESYGNLKAYLPGIDLYQYLMNKTGKKNEEWLYKIADYSFQMGDLDKASQTCLLIPSGTLDSRKDQLMGRVCFAQQKYKEALQHFDKVFRGDKASGQIGTASMVQYVESLIQMGRYEDGLSCLLKKPDTLEPGDADQKVRLTLLESKCHEKLKHTQKAIESLEAALPMVQNEDLRNQLIYQLSALFLTTGEVKKATEKLTLLAQSSQPFWKTAAQQQLNTIQMQSARSKPVSF